MSDDRCSFVNAAGQRCLRDMHREGGHDVDGTLSFPGMPHSDGWVPPTPPAAPSPEDGAHRDTLRRVPVYGPVSRALREALPLLPRHAQDAAIDAVVAALAADPVPGSDQP